MNHPERMGVTRRSNMSQSRSPHPVPQHSESQCALSSCYETLHGVCRDFRGEEEAVKGPVSMQLHLHPWHKNSNTTPRVGSPGPSTQTAQIADTLVEKLS